MIIVDGRALALEIRQAVAEKITKLNSPPRLGVVACDPNFATVTYLELKNRIATSLGITMETTILPASADTAAVVLAVKQAAQAFTGVIVQLPLPPHIDTAPVLAAIPPAQDVDVFRYQGEDTDVLPPVVGAIDVISKKYKVEWGNQQVVIFGSGRLVGLPASYYARFLGAEVTIITVETDEVSMKAATAQADIIILGVGRPNILTADMVKPGVVVFDAGASEDGGVIVGDAHPEVANKATLFTPVPGGIGPLTIALLFHNLVELHGRQ